MLMHRESQSLKNQGVVLDESGIGLGNCMVEWVVLSCLIAVQAAFGVSLCLPPGRSGLLLRTMRQCL
ncbi:hypothetical protein LOD59_01345 [Xylella fastidiosa subsp. multiplex]|nr:hypothetical protein [Xylella fastidiosa]ERI59569.1 hypothetical protein M233_08930 [Xylella fastidiosa subsp. multiplex Griffin-1]MDD0926321.1 hypothetical protein [Xylella fastidiosa subsp. multiplex]QTX29867.1 hypothetical protein KBP48_10560 [Xylella fastidiosa subsp. multiplex]